nr:ATP-binding protein [Gloeothece verrucosa]
MFIWWGKNLINLYNDAYIPILGKRHPKALGRSANDIWSEIWHSLGPLAYEVLNNGNPSWNEELLEIMERNGYREEAYFTFSYSPIGRYEDGVGGIFCACTEDTLRVLDERRLRTLRDLGAETAHAKTVNEACQISANVLANNLKDIPFALFYLLDSGHQQVKLVSTTNLEVGTLVSPSVIELADEASDCWSLNSILATGENRVIHQLIDRFGSLPGGAWDESPNSAIALPLTRPGHETLGVLIAGISPYKPLDDDYRGFFDLVAAQVTTAIANTLAYEDERKRAEALVELDRAKTAFFSNVSHEFRTPLTLMLGPAEDALSDASNPLAPLQYERIKIIHRNGLRLLKLVNTLLDFSRIESERVQAVYEPTDLATFTAELASVFRSCIEKAALRLVVDCPLLAEPVYVDREMWEKIVLNLLSNAFKFTFSGEIKVSLRLVASEQEKLKDKRENFVFTPSSLPIFPYIELSVQDTGIGIPRAEIPHLFERFHRVKGAKGRTYEGSGIGLSLVLQLIKLHSGIVGVSSTLGEGSCFKVFIPSGSAHLPPERIGATPIRTSTAMSVSPYVEEALQWLTQETEFIESSKNQQDKKIILAPSYSHIPSPSKSRILLVDDNADMRHYVSRLLSERWQVETAANGAIALEMIAQQLPDLVLTDVMMPELDGFGLLNTLRADPITKSIPIILLSARAGKEATIEGLEAGADDYLIKPFSTYELIARVQTQLQMSRLRQEQSANRFKNEFLQTVTHELQAPLAAILSWARLLQSQSFDGKKTAQALASIERNATIEAKLVKDLLDVSSILSGKLRLQLQPVDLVPLTQDVITTLRQTAQAKQILLIERLPDPGKQVILTGDPERLKQIMSHLLSNAIKFTPNKGKVYIELDDLAFEARLRVTDTGIGISSNFLVHVFERFSQAEVPSRHSPGGVGIGLAIARYLVELHQGTIEVASGGEGRGATFTVRLPLINSTQLNSDAPVEKE